VVSSTIDLVIERRTTDTVGSWPAMGCDVQVIVSGTDEISSSAVRHARDRIAELELLWSRFVDHSEVSQLNRSSGRPLRVADETRRLVELMQEGVRATGGAFDPTMIVPLVRLGYGESLDGSGRSTVLDTDLHQRGDTLAIESGVDDEGSWVRLPAGTALDPGGIGKGFAADIVVNEIEELFGRGALVSIGGDVSVGDPGPENEGWRVVVLDPDKKNVIDEVRLARGGVATSSVRLRRFADAQRGAENHHLLDPTSLAPIANGTFGATVVAGSAAWAEILTKWLMVEGRDRLAVLDRLGIGALIVDVEGCTSNNAWHNYEEK